MNPPTEVNLNQPQAGASIPHQQQLQSTVATTRQIVHGETFPLDIIPFVNRCIQFDSSRIHPITALNQAVTRPQRIHALQTALHVFSHKNSELHNYEVDCGAANALCLKLGYIYRGEWEEMDMILSTLQCVYSGCAKDRLLRSFREIGQSELLPLLGQVLFRVQSDLSAETVLLRVIVLLRIFAKLEPCKHSLIVTNGLMESMATLLQQTRDHVVIKWELLGCFKDLSFRSRNQDRELLFNTPSLIPTLVQLTTTSGDYTYVAAIWWNFALFPPLANIMAQTNEILESIHLLLLSQSIKARRSALSALGNLASHSAAHAHIIPICMEALQCIVLQDNDLDCQRRAMRTIRCLAITFSQQEGFLEFLVEVIVADNSHVDTMVHALESMAFMAQQVELRSRLVTALLTAVEVATEPKITIVACRTLLSIPDQPTLSSRISEAFLTSLETASKDLKDKEHLEIISKLLVTLSDERSEKLMTIPVMNILALLASRSNDIMRVIYVMAETKANRRPMAGHDALVSSVVSFALSTSEGPEKENAKTLILKLVTEL